MTRNGSDQIPDKPTVPEPRAGLKEAGVLLPLAVAICIVLGWYVLLDYERAVAECVAVLPGAGMRVRELRLMLGLAGVGGLGMAFLAAREVRRRRLVEAKLRLAGEALARRVERRTRTLVRRTRDLRESQRRVEQAAGEAEAAYAAGQGEAADAYLHGMGNALSAFEAELLRLERVLGGAARLAAAFDGLVRAIDAGDREAAVRHAAALRQAVLERAVPLLAERTAALGAIKARMLGDLEARRGAFEGKGRPRPFLSSVRLDMELAAMLERMPRAAGFDPVARSIEPGVTVRLRKQPFLAGLAALLRQSLDAAPGAAAVRLVAVPEGGAAIVLEGAPEPAVLEPPVAAFINFLNENDGNIRFYPATPGQPSRLVLTVAGGPVVTPGSGDLP